MINLDKEKTKSLVALHGWAAIFLGFLLYAVVATGTVAVLAEEIEQWSIGRVNGGNPLVADIDTLISEQSQNVDPEFLEEIGIGASPHGNLSVFFHTHQKNEQGETEDYGVQLEIDKDTGEVLDRRKGTGRELFRGEEATSLGRFLVDIHTELHLPRPWGLLLTGILGLAMMVAAVSGLLMHRHLFADLFVLRKNRSEVLKHRDLHTVAGTWGIPFAFILAFTGSFFSFTGSFGLPAMAMVAFGGDQEALIRTLLAAPETETDVEAPPTSINAVVDDAHRRGGAYPRFLSFSHYGKEDAKIVLFLPSVEAEYERRQFEYSGVSGQFLQVKPIIGKVPSAGSAVVGLMAPLHFGSFASLLSKFIWVALGFASCYVILSGFTLWIERRREDARWGVFERFSLAFGVGVPIAMLASAVGYFLAAPMGVTANMMVPAFFCVAAIGCLLAAAFFKSAQQLNLGLLVIAAALCFLVPLLRWLTGGVGWFEALGLQNPSVIMIDVLLLGFGGFTVFQIKQARQLPAGEMMDLQDETPGDASASGVVTSH